MKIQLRANSVLPLLTAVACLAMLPFSTHAKNQEPPRAKYGSEVHVKVEYCVGEAAVQSRDVYIQAAQATTKMAEKLSASCGLVNPLACVMAQGALAQAKVLAAAASGAETSALENTNNAQFNRLTIDTKKWDSIARDLAANGVTELVPKKNETAKGAVIKGREIAYADVLQLDKALLSKFSKEEFQFGLDAYSSAKAEVLQEFPNAFDEKQFAQCKPKPSQPAGAQLATSSGDQGSSPGGATQAVVSNPPAPRGPAFQPQNLAGLFVLFEGTPIGIKQDNLFDIVGRRYRQIDSVGGFIR